MPAVTRVASVDLMTDTLPSPRVGQVKSAAAFAARTALFAALAYAVFGWLFMPITIRSTDMQPTYPPGSLTFCFRPGSWFGTPARGDVVFVRLPESRRLLLSRIVAVAGDTVGFAAGRLVVNGRYMREPYVAEAGNWSMAPTEVKKGCLFVVGDNRSLPIDKAPIGQVSIDAIAGVAVW
jgi:signal peptidase I